MIKEAKSAAKRQYIESLKQTILDVGIATNFTVGKVKSPHSPSFQSHRRLTDTKQSSSGCCSLDPSPQIQSGTKSPVPLTQAS